MRFRSALRLLRRVLVCREHAVLILFIFDIAVGDVLEMGERWLAEREYDGGGERIRSFSAHARVVVVCACCSQPC